MSSPLRKQEDAVEMVNITSADIVDWSRNCFPIGVEIEDKELPWLPLDLEDLKILHKLLMTPTMVKAADGYRTIPPAAGVSESLKKMAYWAEAAAKWLEKRNK